MADERDRPGPAPDAAGPQSPSAVSPSGTSSTLGARAARRRTRRRRLLVGGGSAGVVAIAAIVVAVLALGGGSHTAKQTARRTQASSTSVPTSVPPTGPTTMTVVPRSSNPVVALAQQYDGLYVGTYTNQTFNTTGTATLELRIDPTAGALHVALSLTGDLFGGGAKQVRHIDGTIQLGNPNAPVNLQTDAFGTVTGKLSGLSLVLTAPNVPDAKVQRFQLNGSLRRDLKGFDATFTIGFRDGKTAQGAASVLCSVTGQRPSQVPTLCASA